MAEAAASRSFDEALLDLSRSTGAEVPKRQAEQLAARAAEDFDAFYEARRAAAGEPAPEESVVVLTFDGKGVVLHREDLREATRKAAERRRRQREQLSPFNRLKPGEKKHSKRMATVAAVYTVAPFVRSVEEFLQSLMPRQPLSKTKKGKKARTPAVRPRPGRWASLSRRRCAMLEAEATTPSASSIVDGAETQLDLVEAGAAEFGVEVTVILDIIHVVEYVWKAAHVFHREGSPELSHWAWTRVRSILEGKSTRVQLEAGQVGHHHDLSRLDRDLDSLAAQASSLAGRLYLAMLVQNPMRLCERRLSSTAGDRNNAIAAPQSAPLMPQGGIGRPPMSMGGSSASSHSRE